MTIQNRIGNYLFDATTAIVSSTLGIFSPARSSRYIHERSVLKSIRARSYLAARRTGPNQLKNPQNLSGEAEIRADYKRVLARARDLARNNPYVAGAVETFAANVVGPGIMPHPTVTMPRGGPDERTNAAIKSLFNDWADWIGFAEKQDLIAQHLVVDGEILAYFVHDPSAPKSIPPFNIQLLECDQLDEWQPDQQMPNGNILSRGIEMDRFKRPVSFRVFDYHPGDLMPMNFSYASRTISADDMTIVMKRTRASQNRGISWLASIIMRMMDLDEYQDNEMIGAKLAAAFGIFIKSPFSEVYQDSDHTQTAADGRQLEYIEPGRIERLLPGEEIQIAKNERPGTTYGPFVNTNLHGAAAGAGMSYESFSGDYSQSTYSSARSALLEERRKYRRIQRILCRHFNDHAYRKFLEYAWLSGLLKLTGYGENRLRYASVQWETPGWEWVDPMKDAQGAEKELALGLNTRSRILAAKGLNYEDVIAQLGKEIELAKQYGVDVTPADKRETLTGAAPPDATDTGGTQNG